MAYTLLDYVHWYGELSSIEHPYNEIDYLIFTQLSYVYFDEIFPLNNCQSMTLYEAYQKYITLYDEPIHPSFKQSHELFLKAAPKKRYQNIRILHFYNEINKDLIKQFAAVAFQLENQHIFIAYRGTDDSLIGWHEDFLMLCEKVVPSQTSALNYLKFISNIPYQSSLIEDLKNPYLGSFKERFIKHFQYKKHGVPLLLGGHSKGGHLSMYAGVYTTPNIQERILHIYNYDGPGFQEETLSQKSYNNMLPKITSYIPHYSFFGIVLGHNERYYTIHSQSTGIVQHNAFSWNLDAHGFIKDELSEESVHFALKVLFFLKDLSYEEKRTFVDTLFGLFDSLDIHTFSELSHLNFIQIVSALKQITTLSSHTRKILLDALNIIWLESLKAKE